MIIIAAGSYINPELMNEVGEIPPCFLPVANKTLLEHQVHYIRNEFGNEKIFVTLPSEYQLSLHEKKFINTNDISIIQTSTTLSLGESLLRALNEISISSQIISNVKILFGDTLLLEYPSLNDVVGVSPTTENYKWYRTDGYIWCGYFAFSNANLLIASIKAGNGDFINGVNIYSSTNKLTLETCATWMDFGHVNTYFKSRANFTTQRSFNDLRISNGIVWKSGDDQRKIEAEYKWLLNIPSKLRIYTPQLLSWGTGDDLRHYYEIEYLPFLPLNEFFVHSRVPYSFWLDVQNRISTLLSNFRKYGPKSNDDLLQITDDITNLCKSKTYERLHKYSELSSFDLEQPLKFHGESFPSLLVIAEDCIQRVKQLPVIPAVLHGDLCFSNILFDSRTSNIKLIDPRGLNFEKRLTIYGDQKYDIAKLAHSFVGLYDLIMSDNFSINDLSKKYEFELAFDNTEDIDRLGNEFLNSNLIEGFKNSDVLPLTVLLFLSMLPLHSDNPRRQKAMIANALRLYKRFVLCN